jgi:molybdopterin-guanine dinucleotide biosynthesis protein
MKPPIIVVGGVHKGAGKTTLTCFLLGHLPGWGALKVTTTHEGTICPVEASCAACGELQAPYALVRDPAVLQQDGTDTWRLGEAGAARVAWLRSTPQALAAGLAASLPGFAELPGVVVEGTNVARHLGDLYLLAARPPVRRVKPSALATAGRADLAVLNLGPGWQAGGTERLEAELPVFRGPRLVRFRGGETDEPENRALLEEVLRRLSSRSPSGPASPPGKGA